MRQLPTDNKLQDINIQQTFIFDDSSEGRVRSSRSATDSNITTVRYFFSNFG
jgi:hypothetical protein